MLFSPLSPNISKSALTSIRRRLSNASPRICPTPPRRSSLAINSIIYQNRGPSANLTTPTSPAVFNFNELPRKSVTEITNSPLSAIKNRRPSIRLEKLIGAGGFGKVYAGRWNGRKVAIKKLKKKTARDECITSEEYALNFSHPNIVRVFWVDTIDSCEAETIIVMEYAGRKNLQHIIDNYDEVLPMNTRIRYLTDLLKALEYMHSKDFVHLDVKPANIIIDSVTDTCKLGDFGCVQKLGDSHSVESNVVGTYAYRAPELFRGQYPSDKSDIYSTGISMWQMKERRVPYENVHHHIIAFKVVSQNRRPSIRLLDSSEEESIYKDIFTQCWQGDPKSRPSAKGLLDVLSHIN
ncbi:unnamed protein product [Dimorphilus gyrociliatus]|uniref:non-specific serine/threonine protein kinase n=1 Tax=Dimorphilus gyrociliatus TaxID=2664684 RepID=A0A7I8V5S0_9ANNE|nr:unnamed protein product [Dimorphilus gyrociliatus]